MAAAELQTQMKANSIVMGTPAEQDKFFSMIRRSQSARMDDQRCFMDPGLSVLSTPRHTNNLPPGPASEQFLRLMANTPRRRLTDPLVSFMPGMQRARPDLADQEVFFTLIKDCQRGRMNEQRCYLLPSSFPCELRHSVSGASYSTVPSGPEGDAFFKLLANCQGRRLNDQRVSLPALPGIHNGRITPRAQDSNYLRSVVSKVQGFCSMPQIHYSLASPAAQRRDNVVPGCSSKGQPVLTSYSPCSDMEKVATKQEHSQAEMGLTTEEDKFFSLIRHCQRSRMDEQRCAIDPSKSPSVPRHSTLNVQGSRRNEQRCSAPHILVSRPSPSPSRKAGFFSPVSDIKKSHSDTRLHKQELSPVEQEKFFSMITRFQRSRMDEQRCFIDPSKSPSVPRHSMLNVQGSRRDEQRCSAPHILVSQPSLSPSPDADSRAKTPAVDVSPQRSTSLSPISDMKRTRSDTRLHKQEFPQAEQDKFYSMITHFQRGRMDEQRCAIDPNRSLPSPPVEQDTEKFFKPFVGAQQMSPLPSLPGIQRTSDQNVMMTKAKDLFVAPPQITLTEWTPETGRKAETRPASPPKTHAEPSPRGPPRTHAEPSPRGTPRTRAEPSPRGPPRSASFSPASEFENQQKPPEQMTMRLSMSFTPQPGRKDSNPPVFPEIFLTLAAPGESLVIPLSPSPGRPLNLNLNLVPNENSHSLPSPRNRGRPCLLKPSSSNTGASKQPRSRPVSPHPHVQRRHASPCRTAPVTSPVGSHENYVSHNAHLHKNTTQGDGRGVSGKGNGKVDQGRGKGKGDGRKDKKEGGKQ